MSGDIPEGWAEKPLNDLVDFLDGQRRPIKSADRNHMRGPYPYYGASGIIDWVNDYLFDDDLILLGEDGENIISRNLPLAFAVSGKIWVNNHAHVLRPKAGVDLPFLTQLLEFQDYADLNSGTAQPKLNLQSCKNFKLILPKTLPEQQAIAAALSDADGVVAGLERVIAKKRLIKQGAMQDLLTARRRLPGFSGEWEVKRLGDLVTSVTGGGTPSRTRSDFWNGPIPWMTVKDFATGAVNTTIESITAEGLKNSASRLVAAGTLILCTRMAVGKTTIMDVDVAINQDLKALSFKSGVSVSFIKRVFEMLQNQIEDNAGGSTVKGISIGDVRGLEFSLPLFDEQQAIAAVLSDMDTEIQTLESRLAKARAVKEGMMQNLLTGRVRLV